MRRKSYRLMIAIAAIITVLTSMSAVAFAAWSVSSAAGNGGSGAGSVPPGSTPTASVANRDVTVSWPPVTVPGHGPASSYRVTRFNGAGVVQTITNNCTGQITGLSCTEVGVPPGQWRYAVAPRYAGWDGADGPMSSAVSVNAPALTLTGSTNLTAVPGTLNGNVASYLPGQSLVFRLDDPTGGQVLTGSATPNSIPAGGGATVQVTVPLSVANGSHTLFAVGSGGEVTGSSFTVAAPAPSPASLSFVNAGNGGDLGRISTNDRVEITFTGNTIAVASLCSTWSGNNSNQSISGAAVTIANGGAGNDVLTVAACSGAFKLGSVNLGHPDFVTANSAATATIAWTASQQRLTLTFTTNPTNVQKLKGSDVVNGLYTPDPAITGASGRLITGTAASDGSKF